MIIKNKVIILLWLIISAHSLSSQIKSDKVTIQWGEEQKESKKSTLNYIAGYDNSGIYALKTTQKGLFKFQYTIEHFNQELSKTQSLPIDIKYQKKNRQFEGIIHFNNELFLFSSYKDQKIKKHYLFSQKINKQSLLIDPELKTISELDYTGERKWNAGNFNYTLSRDSSKLLIYYNLPYNKGENERFGFHVFDKQMNLLWEKQVTLPYIEELFEIEDYLIDKQGNVHLLGIVYKDKRRSKRLGEPNYNYQILSYINNGKDIEKYPVKVENKFITDMRIEINEDQDIICAGFYSDIGSFSIKGTFFLKVNTESKKINTKSFKEFGIDFITQNMTDREEKRTLKKANRGKNIELYEYDLDKIILKKDGGAVLIGEQFYIEIVTRTTTDANGNMSTTTTYYYYYNDIIAVNISPKGEIEWAEKIPKKQITTNDGGFFSSYQLSIYNDNMYFIFNDNPKNLFYREGDKIHNFKKKSNESLVIMVELNRDGQQTREALFSVKDAEVLIRPMVCEQISKNVLILFGQKKKTQRFAKVAFKE